MNAPAATSGPFSLSIHVVTVTIDLTAYIYAYTYTYTRVYTSIYRCTYSYIREIVARDPRRGLNGA